MVTIRREAPADSPAIDALLRSAFAHHPHSQGNEQEIVARLRTAGALTVALVAEVDQFIVGHVAVSPVTISDGTPAWYGLGPAAVLPEYQNRGIGSQLVRAALEQLCHRGAAGCVVLGEPAYYGRFGFRADRRLVLPGVPGEYFQALVLLKGTDWRPAAW